MDAAKSLISMHLFDVLEQARLGKVRRQAPATKKQQSQVKQKMTDHWSLIILYHLQNKTTHVFHTTDNW